MLAVEFEPGLVDAYEGEDKFWRTLQVMEGEPFWISDLEVGTTPRGHSARIGAEIGENMIRWLPRLAPRAPAFMNVRYLHTLDGEAGLQDRRSLLLSWVFADLLGQHAHALLVARAGLDRHGGDLFEAMRRVSRRRLRLAMLRKFPRWLWQRAGLPS